MTFKNLKKYVGARIDELSTLNVYSKVAPEKAVFPYIVFRFVSSSYPWNREDKIVEIDYWDNKQDSDVIMTQSDLVKKGFNLYWQSEGTDGFYRSDIIFEGEIPDTDPNISRIQQRYLLKVR